ncbi:MAG: MbnP family protein [Bacteroidota bacterium]
MRYYLSLIIVSSLLLMNACKKEPIDPVAPEAGSGKIKVTFSHYVNGVPLVKDSMMYTNAASNLYEVNEVKWFLSDLTFYNHDGTKVLVDDVTDKHYVDLDIASTQTWDISDPIPEGTYDSVTFIFGFTPQKNISYMFPNPPEMNMAWPDILGGGYHYMQLNGKWKDLTNAEQNFRFHMGIGRVITVTDTTYNHNHFKATLPASSFTITKDQNIEINIRMNIESWFGTPTPYDFNYWGPDIMENQPAMATIKANGWDVFSIGYIH